MLPRLVLLFQLRAHAPTFHAPEGADSILYDQIASGAAEPLRAYFHSPLYIWFLTALYKVFGRDLFAVRLVQHMLGAAACVVVHHVAWRLFRSRATAMLAGILAALSGPVIFYEAQIGVDAIMPLLVVCSAALVVRASRRGRLVDWALAGAAVGVTALGRAVVLTWLPLLVAWALAANGTRLRRAARAAILAAGAALVIAPVTIRNYLAEGDFVLISANGGLNFYIGNHAGANGGYVHPRGLSFRPGDPSDDFEGARAAEESTGRAMSSAEVSAWWSQQAWAFVRESPGEAARLARAKAQLLVSNTEIMQLQDYDVYGEVAPVLRALPTAAFIVVPGLVGLASLLASRRRPLARRVAWLALLFGISFLPFFVVGRYRTPWLLLLAPFAARSIAGLLSSARARRWPRVGLSMAAGTAVLVVAMQPLGASVPSVGFQYMAFARASLARGDRAAAARFCAQALARDPAWVDASALLARLDREEGNTDAAEKVLAAGLALRPRAAPLRLELGRLRLATHQPDAAADALRASIEADPRSIEAWSALADALRAAGRDKEAEAAARSRDVMAKR
jgi:4-amino-4-deoxy-L-arabinose transferase-like glycosyltransferase